MRNGVVTKSQSTSPQNTYELQKGERVASQWKWLRSALSGCVLTAPPARTHWTEHSLTSFGAAARNVWPESSSMEMLDPSRRRWLSVIFPSVKVVGIRECLRNWSRLTAIGWDSWGQHIQPWSLSALGCGWEMGCSSGLWDEAVVMRQCSLPGSMVVLCKWFLFVGKDTLNVWRGWHVSPVTYSWMVWRKRGF